MRKLILISFLLFCALFSFAQNGLIINVSAGSELVSFKKFNQFIDSYNSFYNPTITKAATHIKSLFVKELELEYHMPSMYFSAGRLWSKKEVFSEFSDNSKQMFNLQHNMTNFEVGFSSIEKDKTAFVSCGLGMSLTRSILDVYYIFPDGTPSQGWEQYWNGIFIANNVCPYINIKAGFSPTSMKWLKIYGKLQYTFGMLRTGWMRDWNAHRLYRPEELPTDVDLYLTIKGDNWTDYTDIEYQDAGGTYVKDITQGLFLQLGISINLLTD